MGVRALLGATADGPEAGGDERARRQAALRRELGALAWLALATFLAGLLLAAAWSAANAERDGAEAVRAPFGAIGALVAVPRIGL